MESREQIVWSMELSTLIVVGIISDKHHDSRYCGAYSDPNFMNAMLGC